MSEEKPVVAEAAAEATEKKKAAGPAPMMLIIVGVVALLAGGGTGAFVVAPRFMPAAADSSAHGKKGAKVEKGKEHGKKDEKGHGEKSSVYRVDNLIVNPAGSQGQRFLMASVAFDFKDPKVNEEVRAREVEVRDRIISTIEGQTMDDLTRPGARDSLRRRLHHVMVPIAGEDAEFEVYLPQFVIQ